jgi:tRNA-2-methylthio-N6-dimethylallyladenosine synthase
VTVGVTYGAPHHLVADAALQGGTYAVRRTRAGDAWAARQERPAPAAARTVGLGLPSVGAPPPVALPSCR